MRRKHNNTKPLIGFYFALRDFVATQLSKTRQGFVSTCAGPGMENAIILPFGSKYKPEVMADGPAAFSLTTYG